MSQENYGNGIRATAGAAVRRFLNTSQAMTAMPDYRIEGAGIVCLGFCANCEHSQKCLYDEVF